MIGCHPFDHRFLAGLAGIEFAVEVFTGFSRTIRHGVARPVVGQTLIVMAQALELVMRCFDVLVRDQHDLDFQAGFELGDLGALFVEQIGRHLDRNLGMDGGGAFLHRLFLDHPHHVQGRGFNVADDTGAIAARAGDVGAFIQCRSDALARQLHQPETRDLARLNPRTVVVQRFFCALLHLALVLGALHVDEVDDDQAAQIAQSHLACHFVGRFHVGSEGGFLDVRTAGRARRVHVDGHQRLGVIDDDCAARGQGHHPRIGGFDLMFDLEPREQRRVVAVALDPIDHVRHDMAHELLRLLADIVRVEQDFPDVRRKIIPDGADHQARLLIDQEGARRRTGGGFNGSPQLQQVVQVPLQFFLRASDAGCAGNQAHARRMLEPIHDLAQFLAVFALDAARHTAAARVIGHQDQIAAGQ